MGDYSDFLRTEILPYFGSHDKKSLLRQWQDTRELWTKYRCVPYHYWKHRLYERSARHDFLDYMPSRVVRRFRLDRNPRSHVRMLSDKREAVRILSRIGVRCVETLISVSADGTVLQGDGTAVGADTAAEALRARGGTLFFKPIDSRKGLGTSSIDADKIDAALITSMRNVVIQPVLRNHPIIAAMNASALNTVRVATFVDNGRCTIIAALLRVARGDAVIDNWSQGGVAVGIDLKSGSLNQTAITKASYGRRVYEAHPDTDVRFNSVRLPWWRETLELAERTALCFQPHTTLGLDIAITADGPVFIEANEDGGFFILQEACGPLGGTELGQAALANWLSIRTARPQPR